MEASRQHDEVLRVGALEIHPAEGLACAGGAALSLSVHELRLLVALARREGRVVSRSELYAIGWGGTLRDGDRTIDVYIHRLRSKLDTALPDWRHIHTHVGFGYRLSPVRSHAFHKEATDA